MSIFFYELIGLDTKNIDLIDIGGESYQKDIYVYPMDIYSHFPPIWTVFYVSVASLVFTLCS